MSFRLRGCPLLRFYRPRNTGRGVPAPRLLGVFALQNLHEGWQQCNQGGVFATDRLMRRSELRAGRWSRLCRQTQARDPICLPGGVSALTRPSRYSSAAPYSSLVSDIAHDIAPTRFTGHAKSQLREGHSLGQSLCRRLIGGAAANAIAPRQRFWWLLSAHWRHPTMSSIGPTRHPWRRFACTSSKR